MQLGRKTRYGLFRTRISFIYQRCHIMLTVDGRDEQNAACDLISETLRKQKDVKFDESVFYPHSYKNITYVVEHAW